ncbi:MAG: hypothetical protein IKS05_03540, partial [Oscillospiraceae bacterium]|nr:hypothetical protein [Oscillospiraceae bacterium]
MRILKNICAQLHRFVFWALILSLLWAWIYTFVGDTSREKKVILYVDAYALDQRGLGLRLEEKCLPAGIKMLQVRSFDYDIFGGEINGDLYLMKESVLRTTLEESPEKLAPLVLPAGQTGYEWGGKCWGILAFDPETQRGPAMDYIQYAPLLNPEQEAYYL